MRSKLHIALGVLLALGAGACGNLENAPLRLGTIEGELSEYDPAHALVSVVDAPQLRSTVDDHGRFKLEKVPSGDVELFVVATREKATRVKVKVSAGKALDVERVEPKAAGFLELRARSTQGERVAGVEVTVLGTHLDQLQLDGKGRVQVGPLPDGCYELSIVGMGFPEVRSSACVGSGEKKELRVQLQPRADLVNRCAATGCEDGLVCGPGGRCVECVEDDQCGEGLSCKGFRCNADGPQCGACVNGRNCDDGSACMLLVGGGPTCVKSCTETVDEDDLAASRCEAGFTCQAGNCLPDTQRFLSCSALLQFGAECADDERCQGLGMASGLCVERQCTVPCVEDLDCPGASRCEDTVDGRVCSVRD
ncbi:MULTISPECIES: carboxypeptidase regulatory-like domain-containing protein [Myxococcus]|uniref:carboxypeptidase regulatory-like domain-containing protein n=1 Tax=Myxococcus TaxID=32 RepID=UPI0011436809|nr:MULTISPECIES: carboxypeptidase regulatory-like domain-containing protein [Myxococcus]MCK8500548.1 carboxypeptidase regulatory-like domain-containing protein [Myxococcus fulvus]